MTKLKTLKEINEDFLQKKGYDILCPRAFKLLKQEAIKWVRPNDWSKFWKWCKEVKGFDYFSKDITPLQFIEAWIEYFFNITEEVLK